MNPKISTHSPEYILLGLLYEKPNHGYQLHSIIQERFSDIWKIRQSQTYSVLKRLQVSGDISAKLHHQDGLPDRKTLFITEQGRTKFNRWLKAPTSSSVRAIRMDFLCKLHFSTRIQHQDSDLLINNQILVIRKDLKSLQNSLDQIPSGHKINQLAQELRIRHLRSTLEWLEMLPGKINTQRE